MKIHNCIVCNSEFLSQGQRKYCDVCVVERKIQYCKDRYSRVRVVKLCKYCGKVLPLNKQKFCNAKCKFKTYQIEKLRVKLKRLVKNRNSSRLRVKTSPEEKRKYKNSWAAKNKEKLRLYYRNRYKLKIKLKKVD